MDRTDGPATYENEEDRRLARILASLIWASWGVYLFVIITGLFFKDWRLIGITLAGCAILFIPFVQLRKRQLRACSLSLMLIDLVTVTVIATFGQGIRDLAVVAYPVIFIFAGLTLGRAQFRLCVGLTLAAVCWLVFGEAFGWYLPVPFSGNMTNWFYLAGATLILLVAALAVELLATNMRKSLAESKREMAQRKRAENINQARLRLYEFATEHSLEEVLVKTLDEVCLLADSPIGFYHFVDADEQALTLQAWSTRTTQEFCKAAGKDSHYPIEQAGVWVDCVRTRQPVIHNDYPSLPHRKGLPEGHAPVRRELVVPILRHGKIVSILGIGNKPRDFTLEDVELVSHLADAAWEIAQRMRAEEQVRESEDKFKYVFDHSVVGKSFTLPSGELNVNQAFCEMLGYSAEGLKDRKWQEITHPEDVELTQNANKAILSGEKESMRFTKRFFHKNGSIVWADVSTSLRRDKDGRPLYFMTTFLDITERKRAEEEIRTLNADLEKRVEERTHELREAQEKIVRQEKLAVLGQMAGSVGHELRNPLSAINNSVYYLKLVQPEADEKVKKYHGVIEQEVQNADKIIADLLDFSRLKSADRKPVAIPKLVERVLERFPVPAAVEVTLDLPANLPMVYADPRQVEQVLGNLVSNANQAMIPKGTNSAAGRLTISARHENGLVDLAVKDSGVGIPPENMEKLFEPLFTTRTMGIGLGLVVSRMLIEANEGRIEVESEVGKGSTFTVMLPVYKE